jgi:methionyl-tRNA synthetase
VCGSDEHGYFDESQKEGITPQEVIDKYDGIIRKSFIDFDISFDILELQLKFTMIRLRVFYHFI